MTYEKFAEKVETRDADITRSKIGKFTVKFTVSFLSLSSVLTAIGYYTLPAFVVFVVLLMLLFLYIELFTLMTESEKLFKALYTLSKVWVLFAISAIIGVVFILALLG